MTTPFTYLPVAASAGRGDDVLNRILAGYAPDLAAAGGEPRTEGQLDVPGPLFYFVATGGTENSILSLRAQRAGSAPGEPVFLIAHPTANSLPAALEVLACLRQDGIPGRILYLEGPSDARGYARIAAAAHDLAAWHALRQVRLGVVGAPSDWLVASRPDPAVVRCAWGPAVVQIPMSELDDAIEAVQADAVKPCAEALWGNAAEVREPARVEIEAVARVYLALKALVARHQLAALTVRCFDLVLNRRTTGCFGLAELNDEGIAAGCEGDVPSTLGILWADRVLGAPAWMANPAQLDEARDRLWLAHCTVPRRMVTGYRLRSHFESGIGAGIQGTLAPGPVTLLRIGGKALEQVWLAEGHILRSGDAEDLCRTQVEIELTAGGRVADLLRAPLGNHLVLVPGHHAARLRQWWETLTGRLLPA